MRTLEALPLIPAGSCCTPVTKDVLSAEDAERMAIAFKALGDPTRLRLLSIVAASDGDEACVCDLTEPVGLSQPTVSHHLKILMDAGYLTRSKRGTWAYYKLVPGSLDRVSALLATATT
jgi:ArsR family transcriptional regulator